MIALQWRGDNIMGARRDNRTTRKTATAKQHVKNTEQPRVMASHPDKICPREQAGTPGKFSYQ